LVPKVPHPELGNGIPRCELYLNVSDASSYFNRGIRAGAKEVQAIQTRDWGHTVGYLSDPDGHIIALAEKLKP
ncbi:MAG: lactoylglutathione lyase, partial [Crocinitomicaceae bacterium]|nr:lactoylglutathione lyase [Crocinitomicaceae bacterium]